MTAKWESGGWTIKASYTNPNLIVGSSTNLTLVETYEVDGVPVTTVPTEVVVSMPIGANVINKYWTTKTTLSSLLSLETPISTPESEVKIQTDGTLRIKLVAPNDGIPHSVSFRLVYKSPIKVVFDWLMTNPIYQENIRQYLIKQLT